MSNGIDAKASTKRSGDAEGVGDRRRPCPVHIDHSRRRWPFSGLRSFERFAAAPACVRARPVVRRGRSAVARSPSAHRFTNPFPCPLRRNRAGMAVFAIRVGVGLAVPWRGGRPAAATHSPVARLDRACLLASRVIQVRLHGGRRAPQPPSDLGDRQALVVAVVARERGGPAARSNTVCGCHRRRRYRSYWTATGCSGQPHMAKGYCRPALLSACKPAVRMTAVCGLKRAMRHLRGVTRSSGALWFDSDGQQGARRGSCCGDALGDSLREGCLA